MMPVLDTEVGREIHTIEIAGNCEEQIVTNQNGRLKVAKNEYGIFLMRFDPESGLELERINLDWVSNIVWL